MCDYSLYAIPNRLAEEGERVVLHKFDTGTIGFASVLDTPQKQIRMESRWETFCSGMKAFFMLRSCPGVPAVCMPPGTRLMLCDAPFHLQRQHGLRCGDTVTVTEISTQSYAYRDALILPNGKCVLLQELPEGIEAVVLETAPEVSENLQAAETLVYSWR
jgi:hypothetical protein